MTFTKIARICTYISLAAPLIVSRSLFFPFIAGKIFFFRLFTELALIAIAGALAYKEIPLSTVKTVVKKPIFIAISIFTALFTLSAFTAQIPSFAFWSNFERGEGAWQMIHYFLFFFLILLLFEGKEGWQNLITAQTTIATLIGLYAIGQMLSWPSWIVNPMGGAKSGTLGNPDYLGIYMIITGLLSLVLAYNRRGNKKTALLLAAFFQITLFFTTHSRGAFVGVGIGLTFMCILWIFQKKRGWKINTGAGFASFLAICGITFLVLTVKGNAWEDMQPRLWTWESAIAGAIERPITGWGAENFPFIFDAYYNPNHYTVESWFDRAHNAPLEYLTTGGIPLLVAYIAIFVVLYIRLKKRKDHALWPLFMAIPVIYLINGLVLFETLPLYLIFFLFIGFLDAYAEDFQERSEVKAVMTSNGNTYSKIAFFFIIIGVGFSLYATTYLPLRKNMLMLQTMHTDGKTDIEMFQEHEHTLNYRSPVGSQEELQGVLTFTVSYFDYLQNNNLTGQVHKQTIASFMAFNKHWYEKLEPQLIGLKPLYIRITGLLAAHQETKDAAYLKEADRLIAIGTAASPTRIEFVRFALASAALRGDKAAYTAANNKGKILLPSYNWEPDMAKFVY